MDRKLVKYVINGGNPLSGEVSVSGAKNAALAILPAALMAKGVSRIENVPQISDVTIMLEIISELGAKVRFVNASTVEIDPSGVRNTSASYEAMRKMRASYYMVGVMLGMYGSANVAMPGGCDIGVRAIDQHIKGFKSLGAEVDVSGGYIRAYTETGRLKGAQVYFDQSSVGATINVMLAATLAEGQTVIENAAKEPHIVDLANYLNSMGADIKSAGTDVIKIRGVDRLAGCSYSIIPDQIEAGTYIAAVAAAGGRVSIKNVIPKHLECITAKFSEMGVDFTELDDSIIAERTGKLERTNVKTLPYPGFPTDMQPQIATALCLAEGTSMVTESVFDNRYKYVDELKRMGAKIQVDGKVAVVEGVDKLSGAPVRACDLRAGAALVIAGLAAEGITEIENVYHIERGYERLICKFRDLGADIAEVTVPDAEGVSMEAV